MLYSEDSLKLPSFRISHPTNLSEASISRFLRNAYVAVGTAGISAAILGSLLLLYPRLATANWPFTGALAADGSDALLHDPGLDLLEAALNPDPNPLKEDQQLVISADSALLAEGGIDSDLVGQLPDEEDEDSDEDAPAPKKAPEPVKKAAAKTPTVEKKASTAKPAVAKAATPAPKKKATLPAISGSFGNPLPGGRLSQGLHGHNGVDISAPSGTPIYAAASGSVTTVKSDGGWNGGYGNYVVISHPNGTSTLYAHMSRVATSGGPVSKGDLIGYVGNTGQSTGNHLHFEVHGAANPFAN